MTLLAEALRRIADSVPKNMEWLPRRQMLWDAAREVDDLVRPLDEDVKRFHIKFGHPAPANPVLPKRAVMDFRKALIREECEELCAAIDARDLGRIAQEAVDVVYVALGTLVMCGLRLAPFWEVVHRANMAKVSNPGGKPLKPEGWVKPDCGELVGEFGDDGRDECLVSRMLPLENLNCPYCGMAHVDREEWGTRRHRTHLCHYCKREWTSDRYSIGKSFEQSRAGVTEVEEVLTPAGLISTKKVQP